MFVERRWERHHENGWTSVVIQTDADWYKGYAIDPRGRRMDSRREGTHFEKMKDAADHEVLAGAPHDCRCAAWVDLSSSTH